MELQVVEYACYFSVLSWNTRVGDLWSMLKFCDRNIQMGRFIIYEWDEEPKPS
jgi:hypothetical protein